MGTIAQEIARIKEAKSNIKTSIENKGVQVPSNALIDDYSGYVDQIQQGGSFIIDDASYLFFRGARVDVMDNLFQYINSTDFTSAFEAAPNLDLSTIPVNKIFTQGANVGRIFFGISANNGTVIGELDISGKVINNPHCILGNSRDSSLETIYTGCDYENCAINLNNTIFRGEIKTICGGIGNASADSTKWLNVKNFNPANIFPTSNTINLFYGVNFDTDTVDLSTLDLGHMSGYILQTRIITYSNIKHYTLPDFSSIPTYVVRRNNSSDFANLFAYLCQGLSYIETLSAAGKIEYTGTTLFNLSNAFNGLQQDVSDITKLMVLDLEKVFDESVISHINFSSSSNSIFNNFNSSINNQYGPRGIINLNFENQNSANIYLMSSSNKGNKAAILKVKDGTEIAKSYTSSCTLNLTSMWRGNASAIPTFDLDNKTNEDYLIDFFNSLGSNTTGRTRTIKIYTNLYNTISQTTKDIAINKGYSLSYGTT